MKVIIGAGKTVFEGWISTQEDEFNLLKVEDFERLFQKEKPEAFLAEHVWEHMTYDEGCIAAHGTDQRNKSLTGFVKCTSCVKYCFAM